MNTSFYIASRLALSDKKSFSRFIIRIAILAVSLSIAIMIIGSAITRGYQEVIQDKFYDCWGHIHITTFLADPSNMNAVEPFAYDSNLVNKIKELPEVKSIQAYTIQSAILKTKLEIEGLLLKGVSNDAGAISMQNYIVNGRGIQFNDTSYSAEVLISMNTATSLGLHCGEEALVYFLIQGETQPRARKIKIVGIYKTGLEEYDNLFAICDSRLINYINQRPENLIHGYEIYVRNKNNRSAIEKDIFNNYIQAPLQTYLIDRRFENVFSWLGMMKMNERIIVLIMLIIAIINMITALLILVMERTQMVGVLKSIGMKNLQIQKIFVYTSLFVLTIGLASGTLVGIGLCFLQQKFEFLHLDENTYYIKNVPIYLDAKVIIFINFISLLVCAILLFIPSFVIKTISPTKALRFN